MKNLKKLNFEIVVERKMSCIVKISKKLKRFRKGYMEFYGCDCLEKYHNYQS